LQDKLNVLTKLSTKLKTKDDQVLTRVDSLLDDMKQLQQENDSLQQKLSNETTKELVNNITTHEGVQILAEQVIVKDMNQLRNMMDTLKEQLPNSVILLAAENNGKVQLIAGVSKELNARGLHAGKLIAEAAKKCQGGGGGRPDMAQAGGKDPSKIKDALGTVLPYVENNLK